MQFVVTPLARGLLHMPFVALFGQELDTDEFEGMKEPLGPSIENHHVSRNQYPGR